MAGLRTSITLRAGASSAAPTATAVGAPCVLSSLGARVSKTRPR